MLGSLMMVPPPLLPLNWLHEHCVDGHEQSTVYFVSPQLQLAVVSQSPLELTLVLPVTGEHVGCGEPTSTCDGASFLATASRPPGPPSELVPPSSPSIFPPHAASATASASQALFFMRLK